MNHQAEVRIQGTAKTCGNIGVHMSAKVNVIVPLTASFGPPVHRAKEMKVDSSKVTVNKPGG